MPAVQLSEFLKKSFDDVTFVPITNCQSLFLMMNLLNTFGAYEHRKRSFVCWVPSVQQRDIFLKDIMVSMAQSKSDCCKEFGGNIFDALYAMGHDPTRVHERIILTPLYVLLLGCAFNEASATISHQSGSVGSLALFESDEDHFPPFFYSAAAFASAGSQGHAARRTQSTPGTSTLKCPDPDSL